jgi:hypothetical protein
MPPRAQKYTVQYGSPQRQAQFSAKNIEFLKSQKNLKKAIDKVFKAARTKSRVDQVHLGTGAVGFRRRISNDDTFMCERSFLRC